MGAGHRERGQGAPGDPGGRAAVAGGGGGQLVRAAGFCPRRGLTVSGPGLRYVWKQGGGCWLASFPGASWVEASGTRAGGLERRAVVRALRRGPAGWGARTEAGSSPRPLGGPGPPGSGAPRPRRSGGLRGLPGAVLPRGPREPVAPAWKRGRAAGPGVPAAWGAGGPCAPGPGRKADSEGRVQR